MNYVSLRHTIFALPLFKSTPLEVTHGSFRDMYSPEGTKQHKYNFRFGGCF